MLSRTRDFIAGAAACLSLAIGMVAAAHAGDDSWRRGKPIERRITCYSAPDEERFCSAINDGQVRLVRNRGGAGCVEGDTWRHDDRGVYVRQGCQGEFVYRALSDGIVRDTARDGYFEFRCSSTTDGERFCAIDNRGVRFLRWIDSPGCNEQRNWRHTGRGIFVSGRCRAVFGVQQDPRDVGRENEGRDRWDDER